MEAKKSTILFVKVLKSLQTKNQLQKAAELLVHRFDKTVLTHEGQKKEMITHIENQLVIMNRKFYKCSPLELRKFYAQDGEQLFSIGDFLTFIIYQCNVLCKDEKEIMA